MFPLLSSFYFWYYRFFSFLYWIISIVSLFFIFFYSKTSFFLIPRSVTTHSYMSTWYSTFYFILCVLHVSLKLIKSCLTTNLQKSLSYLADLIFQNKQFQIFFSVTTECLFSLFVLIKILFLLFFQSFFFSSWFSSLSFLSFFFLPLPMLHLCSIHLLQNLS